MNPDIIELTGMLIIMVFIIAVVQWLLLRFTHWSIALGATAFMAIVIAGLYVSLSNATPNGGSNGPDLSEYVTPIIIVFTSLLFGFFIVAYLSKTQLPKNVWLFLGGFIVLFSIGRYVYQYVDSAIVYQENFSSCEIQLINKSGNKQVREIAFNNSVNSLTCTINPNDNEQPYPVIPRDTDRLIFTCHSDKTGIFRQDFPFDYNLCKEKEGKIIGLCFWLHEKVVLPVKIVLNPSNKVDLYINNKLVQHYQLSQENVSNNQGSKGKYK